MRLEQSPPPLSEGLNEFIADLGRSCDMDEALRRREYAGNFHFSFDQAMPFSDFEVQNGTPCSTQAASSGVVVLPTTIAAELG